MKSSGFHAVVANEIDASAVDTIRLNSPKTSLITRSVVDVTLRDLSKAAGRDVKGIPLLSGGPPCQAFSTAGNRRGLGDSRGRLVYEFVRLVGEVLPKVFVMENVRGLLSIPIEGNCSGSLFRDLISQFEAIGYRVDCFLVNSANYGAPQTRERMMCVGNRHRIVSELPPILCSNRHEDGLKPFSTLRDAIGEGFVDPDPSCMDFSERKKNVLALVPPGGNWRSLPKHITDWAMKVPAKGGGGKSAAWRRLSFDHPCPTVLTQPDHAQTSLCHPTETRALTVGEMAAVQGFPRDWRFCGDVAARCRQIGNAVPTILGRLVGDTVRNLLERIADGETATRLPSRVVHIRPHIRTRKYWRNGEAFSGSSSYYGLG